ncbi:hypothetical protein CMI47_22940 [Candidatus Pacearchaeota archaeon]|nr:hypothetical protein [Candidatus Pacearchaeota archaeon]|tara:strand:- start:345 stop:665 length:321 start_codon:yes stop_codon:yes gene_type:complete
MKKIAGTRNYRLIKKAGAATDGQNSITNTLSAWTKQASHLDAKKINAVLGLSGLMALAVDLIESNVTMGRSPSGSTDDAQNANLQTYLNDIANLISSERWPKSSSS